MGEGGVVGEGGAPGDGDAELVAVVDAVLGVEEELEDDSRERAR